MEVNNEKHLVAFLDILGFKEYVNNYVNGDRSILTKIQGALENSTNRVGYISKAFEKEEDWNLEVKYNQFSDCTSISFKHPSIL